MEGWTGNYLRVSALAPSPRWNEVDEVALEKTSENGIMAGSINLALI